MKRVCYIYNPYSGEKKARRYLDYMIKCYQKEGFLVEPFRVEKDGDIDTAAKRIGDEHVRIVVAGGDGTINSVVNCMKRNNIDLPLAIIPTGTANDLANLLGYSNNIKAAIRQSATGVERKMDIGRCGDRYFVNVLSAGLFTDISQKTPTVLKNTFGKLAYYFTSYVNSIQELPKFKLTHISIEADEVKFEGNSIVFFVFNGKTAGNMKLASLSNPQDGLLDVIIVKGDNIAETIRTVFHFLARQLSGVNTEYPKGVVHFKTKRLRLSSKESINIDIDGEHGPATPFDIECLPSALKVIVPDGLWDDVDDDADMETDDDIFD